MKKCLLSGLVIMLLLSLGGVVGCGTGGIPGTYVNQDNPSEYLELDEDGTFYLKEMGLGVSGEWEVKGSELRLQWMGMVFTAEIKGNKLYDQDGKVWVKQSKPSKEETLAPAEPTTPAATTEDIEWLATVIASEAGSVWDVDRWVRCTDEERAAVGWTVLNRLSKGTFGETVEEVVTTPGQYAHNQQPTEEIRELAKQLLEEEISDATGGATHFFSPISMPKEGESTTGFDVGGGLHQVPGITKQVYFPSWTITYTWVGDLSNVRRACFMFYQFGEVSTPAPTSTPTLESGSWTKTVISPSGGSIIIKYIEIASAKDKILVWIDIDPRNGGINRSVKNISAERIHPRFLIIYKDENGREIVDPSACSGDDWGEIGPGQIMRGLSPEQQALMGAMGKGALRRGIMTKGSAQLMRVGTVGLNIALFGGTLATMAYTGTRALGEQMLRMRMDQRGPRLEWGTGQDPFPQSGSLTERQRAITAIQGSQINGRSYLGSEAALMAEGRY